MRWSTLFNRIGKQPLHITQSENIYALLRHPVTGERVKVYLRLAFDYKGRPYLLLDEKAQELYHVKQRKESLCLK